MKRLFLCVLCLTMSALIATAGGEKTKFDGTWTATGGSSDGKKIPAEIVDKLTLVLTIRDNTYKVTITGKEVESGTWKLDEKAKPKALDLTIVKGKDEGKKQLGILKLEGDVMTVAFGKAGGDARPKNFDGGDGIEVTIFKRGK